MQSCLLGKNVKLNGEPIAVNRPYVFLVKKKYIARYCSYCFKEDISCDSKTGVTLKACAKCNFDRCCNRECQKKAWRYHKATCSVIAKGIQPDDNLRMMTHRIHHVALTLVQL